MPSVIDDEVEVRGGLRVAGLYEGTIRRTNMQLELAAFELPLTGFRVHDAFHTLLPAVGASDDLGLATGTYGVGLPYLSSRDLNAAGATTHYARILFELPVEYLPGGTIEIRLVGGMLTSVASVSATLDAEAFFSADDTLVSGSDLVTTSAQSINSLTFAEVSFVVTPTSRQPSDLLDLRIAFIGNSATASSHFAAISRADMILQVKG